MRVVLYNDGGDALRTKLLSTACSGLVAQCPVAVPVRTQEPVVVYVNGDYRGLYSRREDIADAIARFEGLDSAATLNVADVNKKAFCGDPAGIASALKQLKALNRELFELGGCKRFFRQSEYEERRHFLSGWKWADQVRHGRFCLRAGVCRS